MDDKVGPLTALGLTQLSRCHKPVLITLGGATELNPSQARPHNPTSHNVQPAAASGLGLAQ